MSGMNQRQDLLSVLKDRAIFCGWIAALLLAGGLVWVLTSGARERVLLKAINRALIQYEDPRRLGAPLPSPKIPGKMPPLGSWFSLSPGSGRLFVFGLFREGMLLPCGALVSEEGRVEEVLPLSGGARQIFDRIPEGVFLPYIRRIEEYAAVKERKK
jgi:hypothetical protein